MVLLDTVEFVSTFLGAMRIGAIPVLTNPLLPGADLGAIVSDSRARTVVISEERLGSLEALLAASPEVTTVIVAGPTSTGEAASLAAAFAHIRIIAWDTFTAASDNAEPYETWVDSPGFWLCTSGTTGQPKLAMHTHGDIKVTVDTYAKQVLEVSTEDRCYSVGPMFHAYGLGNSLTFPFAAGATTILVPTRPPTPELVAHVCAAETPTLFFCIPTFYAALTNADIAADCFASVRLAVSAAEALPAETFERFQERFGVTILDGIGSTEMLHIFVSNRLDHLKAGTSGGPVRGYELRVVDEHDHDVGPGVAGELWVKGSSSALGYWCRSEASRSTFVGPWVRTGDLYMASDDGFYTYLGRADDMLRVGGEWVSPTEVEGVLIGHESVLEAAVVGQRDPEDPTAPVRPIAFVIAAPGHDVDTETLRDWCQSRLAGYKRPRRYVIVDGLPKTATGKIQRFKLRSQPPPPRSTEP